MRIVATTGIGMRISWRSGRGTSRSKWVLCLMAFMRTEIASAGSLFTAAPVSHLPAGLMADDAVLILYHQDSGS